MQKSHLWLVFAAFTLSALGCAFFIPGTPAPAQPVVVPTRAPAIAIPAPTRPLPTAASTATPAPTEPPAAPTVARLTTQQLRNAEYQLPQYGQTVTLKDGQYEAGSGADYISAVLSDQIAFGDLNGDGIEDAAVLLAENGGGSGVFVSVVAMLNQGGQPVQTSNRLVDDRPKVDGLAIENGQIVVTADIHGATDPGCCPAFPVVETFAWTPINLVMVRLSSKTADGTERAIHLEQPAPGAEVSGSVQVQGTFTVSPFENTLSYRVVDDNENKLAQGTLPAKSNGTGGPGTFGGAIDLSGVPSGTTGWLQIVDVSPADGSSVALDSVPVTVK